MKYLTPDIRLVPLKQRAMLCDSKVRASGSETDDYDVYDDYDEME